MTPAQIALVQSSFRAILPISGTVTALLYIRLFELDPGIRTLFQGDIQKHADRFREQLRTLVQSLSQPEAMTPALRRLGRKHASHQLQPCHYRSFRAALLWALRQALGQEFTPQVEEAWGATIDFITATMHPTA